uniref:Sterile alpha motif domain containing 7 n=1 Tax=Sinocyclocheilus anshuiensis TaxID=1608454 RepID=A0A671K4G6_9TELE
MTPREQLRKISALGEQGALDEKHWYRLVNGMSAGELRQRQELMMRNQMAMAPQILTQGQQRLQGVPAQFDPRFMERELVLPTEMVSADARQIHMGAHLGPPLPPNSNVIPSRGFPGTEKYRASSVRKNNLILMEMNAILHQKELENAHQKGLIGMENPMMYQGIQPNPMAFRGRQRLPDGHDVFVHRNALEDLHANSLLMSRPYPPISTLQRERGRRTGRRTANHKSSDSSITLPKGQSEEKNVEQSPGAASGEEKEVEGKGEMSNEATTSKPHQTKVETELSSGCSRKGFQEGELGIRKACISGQEGCAEVTNCSDSTRDKDISNPCSAFQEMFLYPSAAGPLTGMPYMLPVPGNGLVSLGHPNMFLNGEEMTSLEDIRKWSVDDVYNFISEIPNHMIDGETLPLLTEDHLLDTLGLKLGPALKIRSQLSRRLGNMFYSMMNLPLPVSGLQPPPEKSGDRSSDISSPVNCNSVELLSSPRDTEALKSTEPVSEADNPSPSQMSETT